MFKRLFKNMTEQRLAERRAELYRNLLRHEAAIGGQLFGPVPKGGRREFFCLDPHTWVWHEEWKDQYGQQHVKTTRYDMRPDGILKVQDGHYQSVTPQEATRIYEATKLYEQRVAKEIYSSVATPTY